MTWTAPDAARTDPALTADERTTLEGFLDYHRQTLLHKCAGLTAEQLRTRAVPPSSMSLLGLVRHLSEVERAWFRRRLLGEDLPYLYCTDEQPDGDFDGVDGADAQADLAAYAEEVARAREAAATRDLDATFHHSRYDVDMSLRWVYVHMVEEYARHNGHADLLRERIDGTTGE